MRAERVPVDPHARAEVRRLKAHRVGSGAGRAEARAIPGDRAFVVARPDAALELRRFDDVQDAPRASCKKPPRCQPRDRPAVDRSRRIVQRSSACGPPGPSRCSTGCEHLHRRRLGPRGPGASSASAPAANSPASANAPARRPDLSLLRAFFRISHPFDSAHRRSERVPERSSHATPPSSSRAPPLESGSLRFPHLGDCTHDGQPSRQRTR